LAAKRKINRVSAGRGSASASAKAGFFFDPLDHFPGPPELSFILKFVLFPMNKSSGFSVGA
jgi:hypothetical protein